MKKFFSLLSLTIIFSAFIQLFASIPACPDGWDVRPSTTYQLPNGSYVTNCPAITDSNGICCIPGGPNQ